MPDLMRLSRKTWPYAFLLCTVVAIVYYSVLQCDFLPMWDDADHILNNTDIKSLSWQNIRQMFCSYYVGMYQPLTTLTFALDYQVWGLSAKGFHITNLFLHLVSGVLVFYILNQLTNKIKLSFLFTLIFMLHPVQVEAVAWVSARNTLLSAVFFLLAVFFYLKYIKHRLHVKYILLSFGLFTLAVLSKCSAVTLPFVLILVDYLCGRRDKLRIIVEKIPFLFVSVVIGLVAINARAVDAQLADFPGSYSGGEMLFIAFNSMLTYLGKIIFPMDYSAFYTIPFRQTSGLSLMQYILPVLIATALAFLIIFLTKAKKKLLVFGLLFLFITLSISIKWVPVGLQLMADRYLYLPIVGALLFMVSLINELRSYRIPKIATTVMAMILVAYYAFTTVQYLGYWKNENILFAQTLKVSPDAIPVKNMVGIHYKNRGDLKSAMKIYNQIISEYPRYGSTYNNRGNLWRSLNHLDLALRDYRNGLQYTHRAVDSSSIMANIGIVYAMKNDFEKAMCFFSMAIVIDPKNKQAIYNRGKALIITGDYRAAFKDCNKAIAIDPYFGQAYYIRGIAEANMNMTENSLRDFKIAEQLGMAVAETNFKQ